MITEYHNRPNGVGSEIYIKREDLNHSAEHKINNAIAQVMIAKRMGQKEVLQAIGESHQSNCGRLHQALLVVYQLHGITRHSKAVPRCRPNEVSEGAQLLYVRDNRLYGWLEITFEC
ncbi:hypothetical protein MRB53_028465 [Persea americana]|uniref:Uncharacterized protein n=1 Tax=Persea americana TaxID=3435 RepID=A0ACC2KFR9_PERAE|nr:hypothetical protein MRB53_028465 [Persea americana]